MHAIRLLLLATLLFTARTAAAEDAGLILPRVQIVRGTPAVTAHVEGHAAALQSCAAKGTADQVRTRVWMRWDRRGRIRSIRVKGGTAAYRRCVQKALAGTLPLARRRGGSGSAMFVVPRPSSPDPLAMTAPVDLHACQVDADCTLHFRQHACVPGDPVAVNKLDPAAVLAAYPVTHQACGMGGPQYDKLRAETENRWTAACEASRCVVR